MRQIAQVLGGIVLLAGCAAEWTATESIEQAKAREAAASQASEAAVQQDLATLKQVTVAFHDFDAAKHAGWDAKITSCMTDPGGLGGMGFHYGNKKFINGSVNVSEPELLLYEPEKNGRMRLVAVEYIVPLDMWTSPNPPRLFGRDFHVVDAFKVWALHAWVWEENPSDMFADWNPKVNCDNTTDVMSMSH